MPTPKQLESLHRDDREAFEALVDRFEASPTKQIFNPEDIDRLPEILGLPDRNIA